MNKNLRSKPWK